MSKTVTVGCRLPHGIVLHHPLKPKEKVELAGINKAIIIGADHVTTPVDAEFWETWKTANKGFAPLETGAIFEAKSEAEAKAVAKELGKEKTGFEKLKQDDPKNGVKRVTKKDD